MALFIIFRFTVLEKLKQSFAPVEVFVLTDAKGCYRNGCWGFFLFVLFCLRHTCSRIILYRFSLIVQRKAIVKLMQGINPIWGCWPLTQTAKPSSNLTWSEMYMRLWQLHLTHFSHSGRWSWNNLLKSGMIGQKLLCPDAQSWDYSTQTPGCNCYQRAKTIFLS